MSNRCPRCSEPLSNFRLADVDARKCDACGGAYLTAAALSQLGSDIPACLQAIAELPAGSAASIASPELSIATCPMCSEAMAPRYYGRPARIVLDVCQKHGVFFDAGELRSALKLVARGEPGPLDFKGIQRARRDALKHPRRAAQGASAPYRSDADHPAAEVADVLDVVSSVLDIFDPDD